MKKSLLTIGTAAGFAAFAHGQGALTVSAAGSAGFNTASSSQFASSGWYTGSLTMEVFTIDSAGESSLASTINADETSLNTVGTGIGLIESDFTSQQVSTTIGGSTLGSGTAIGVFSGGFTGTGTVDVGTLGSLPDTTAVYYALVFENAGDTIQGAIVLDAGTAASGVDPSTSPAYAMENGWPSGDQNILLAPVTVPEPATLALAGLGGLSMLFLRRRKA